VVQQARIGARRAAVRRQLEEVAAGKTAQLSIDLDERVDIGRAIEDITAGLQMDSLPVQMLVVAFKNSGMADKLVERLAATGSHQRATSAHLVGALRMYEAVSWLAPLLASPDTAVSEAAARALGKIGGTRSASALLSAIQRRGLSRRLVAELARAAPDFFVEAALDEPQRGAVRPALAIAAGLRRRHTAVGRLIRLLQHGSPRERAISCRSLGWIGARTAVPVIAEALQDRDPRIRASAAKALGALRAGSSTRQLERSLGDGNRRVRKAALQALRRLDREGSADGA
jgi:HEAT repeat protein